MAARYVLGLRAVIALAAMCLGLFASGAHAGGTHSCCRADGSCVVLVSDDDTCITFVPNDACGTVCPQPEACCDEFTGACSLSLSSQCSGAIPGSPTCAPGTCDIGACCNSSDGTCSITGPSGCLDSYLSGETCTPNPCTGACCDDADGSCSVTTPSLCGGTFMAGQMCSSDPCPIGACCDDFDATCTTTGPGGCFGMFYLGQSCGSDPCESGACCDPFDGACMITGPLGCSGNYTAFEVCSPNPCETGACCDLNSGDCLVTGPTGCAGDYIGAFTTCAPNPCFGACCSTLGVCVESPNSLCFTFTYGQACTPNPCTQPTTCCTDDGSCTVIAVNEACGFGTSDPSSTCMPNPCPQPTACCDAMNACSLTPVGTPCAPGSQSNGSTTCSPNPCTQPSVCCNDNNNTCSLTPAGVPCPAGHTSNPATTCSPANPCPQFAGACCDASSVCHLATFTACSGTWLSGPCFPNNPCTGACCTPSNGACAIGLQTPCEAAGGIFVGGPCPSPCPVACCDSTTGACTIVVAAGCTGTSMNSSCTPDPCAKPTACCDANAGTCSVAAPGASCTPPAVPAALGFQSCTPDPCTYTMFACCTGTTCALSTRPACTGIIPTGDPTSCTPSPCGGACCASSGDCTITLQAACVGVFRGDGTTCHSTSCLGACCVSTGTCVTNIRASDCVAVGGTAFVSQTCTPYPCGIGACCHAFDGTCTVATPAACSGTYRGDGVLCASVVCPILKTCCETATGQCSLTGPTCPAGSNELTATTSCTPNPCVALCCNQSNGECSVAVGTCSARTVFGATSCTPNPCPQPPICCNPNFGTCLIGHADPSFCDVAHGFAPLAGATTCTPNPCPPPPVCCNRVTGECTARSACEPFENVSVSTTCSPNPCPQPPICCNAMFGTCLIGHADPAVCGVAGFSPLAGATTCTPSPCPQPGACCSPAGQCTFGGAAACAAPNTFLASGSSCSPNPCPCPPANGGFETGAFTGWTQFGDTSNTVVDTDANGVSPHSGTYHLRAGNGMAIGGIRQTIPANIGDIVTIEFWLFNGSGFNNTFEARFDGIPLVSLVALGSFPYTQYTFTRSATTANPVLEFRYQNASSNFYLDDVTACIMPVVCCDQVTGACTVGTVCSSGAFVGTCSPNPCVALCCDTVTGACSVAAPTCAAQLTPAFGAGTCTPNPCAQMGACCTPTRQCSIELSSACIAPSVFIAGSCAPNPCPCPPLNGGFEAGLTGWIVTGSDVFTSAGAHSGSYAAGFAATGATGTISQVIPAGVGDLVTIEFWFECAGDPPPNSMVVTFDGQTLFSAIDDPLHGYEFHSVSHVVTSANPVLSFEGRNDNFISRIDDVTACIMPRIACCNTTSGACTLATTCPAGSVAAMPAASSCTPDPCLGACCTASSMCNAVLIGACPPGSFFLGVSCTPNPCAGACCESNGACGLSTQSACSGNFLGGSCSPNPCPQPIACCDDLTGACSVSIPCPPGTTAASPTSSSCSPAPCPGGACCINCMDCIVTLPATCAAQGGVFNGAGVACAGNCPLINGGFETGSFSGWTPIGNPLSSTVVASFGSVNAHGGTFYGRFGQAGTPGGFSQNIVALAGDRIAIDFWYRLIGPGTPNSFTAEFAGSTLVSIVDDTTHLDWAPFHFDVIAPVNNPALSFLFRNDVQYDLLDDVSACVTPMEACCDTTSGVCSPVAVGTCGGVGQGHGVTCSPNPCAQPTACCNTISGACSIAPPLAACPSGTTTASPAGSTCTSTTCPQGACCNDTTNICTITAPGGCPGGAAFKGIGTTCNPHPCPPVLMPVDGGVTLDSRGMCNTTAEAIAFVSGAFTAAPNCPLVFSVSPPPPYPIGTTPIVLTATDCNNLSTSVNTSITILGVDCNSNTIPDTCECFWNNGVAVTPAAAGINDGQLSHIGGGAGIGFTINSGQRVADDFYVCPNQMHHIYGFCGWMYTNSFPGLRKARLDVFEDCNGVPALLPFKSYTNSVVISTTPATGGFDLVQYCFDFCTDPLWLDGGSNGKSYWVSLQGVTDNQGTDTSFWVAVPGARTLLGSVPVKGVGAYAPLPATPIWGPWAPIADCCIGCVNMAFSLQGESCPFIWNNGGPDLGAGRGGSPSMDIVGGVQTRTADDFVTRTCADQEICYIDAWIWTNCDPAIGFIEIYRNKCAFATHDHADPLLNRPAGNLPESAPFLTLAPTKVISTGQTATINGALMNGYRLQFYPPPNIIIPAGETLWISAGGKNLGNVGGRAYFAYAADCNRACSIRLNPGVTRSLVPSQSTPAEWQPSSPPRDFAFRIAVKYAPFIFGAAAGGSPRPIGCPIDINNDQNINTQDIFDYLSAWFGGCP